MNKEGLFGWVVKTFDRHVPMLDDPATDSTRTPQPRRPVTSRRNLLEVAALTTALVGIAEVSYFLKEHADSQHGSSPPSDLIPPSPFPTQQSAESIPSLEINQTDQHK